MRDVCQCFAQVSAQCTVVNFIVTPEGLEAGEASEGIEASEESSVPSSQEQVLAMVVNCEKPQLEEEKQALRTWLRLPLVAPWHEPPLAVLGATAERVQGAKAKCSFARVLTCKLRAK